VSDGGTLRFACTACGRCCDRGPEMELGEATRLSGRFITRLIFKRHSLPLHANSRRAAHWRRGRESRRPIAEALDEARAHLVRFSVLDEVDRGRGRSTHLTVSALTVDAGTGRCPALVDDRCSVYEARPLTCRTVPLHYSRPASSLGDYLHAFVRTPGYRCDTTTDAPVLLDGDAILDIAVQSARDTAMTLVETDGPWRRRLVELMRRPDTAFAAGLPTLDVVARNAEAGSATLVSMLIAWRVGRDLGLIKAADFERICREQVALLQTQLQHPPSPPAAAEFRDMLLDYELEQAKVGGSGLPGRQKVTPVTSRPAP